MLLDRADALAPDALLYRVSKQPGRLRSGMVRMLAEILSKRSKTLYNRKF